MRFVHWVIIALFVFSGVAFYIGLGDLGGAALMLAFVSLVLASITEPFAYLFGGKRRSMKIKIVESENVFSQFNIPEFVLMVKGKLQELQTAFSFLDEEQLGQLLSCEFKHQLLIERDKGAPAVKARAVDALELEVELFELLDLEYEYGAEVRVMGVVEQRTALEKIAVPFHEQWSLRLDKREAGAQWLFTEVKTLS